MLWSYECFEVCYIKLYQDCHSEYTLHASEPGLDSSETYAHKANSLGVVSVINDAGRLHLVECPFQWFAESSAAGELSKCKCVKPIRQGSCVAKHVYAGGAGKSWCERRRLELCGVVRQIKSQKVGLSSSTPLLRLTESQRA